MTTKRNGKSKGVTISGEGKYPLVPIKNIEIVERPKPGEIKLFYNPRSPESFDPESMRKLRTAIQIDGLQQPLLVRAITEKDIVTAIHLIAGERRLRSVRELIDLEAPCYDDKNPVPAKYKAGEWVICHCELAQVKSGKNGTYEVAFTRNDKIETLTVPYADLLPTVSAAKLYAHVPCYVHYNCDDRRALRLAFDENQRHEPLTTREEVELVERLVMAGYKQEDIVEMIDQNVTWVSQTASFRTQLPEDAFQKLLAGKLARNGAVNILSFAPEDRQALYDATVKAEEVDRQAAIVSLKRDQEHHEDAHDIAQHQAKKAGKAGNTKAEKKSAKKAASEAAKAKAAADKKAKVEADAGTIRQGHIQKGAAIAGVKPKKAKMLPRQDIEDIIVEVKKWIREGHIDKLTGMKLPASLLHIVKYTLMAMIQGERDMSCVIRTFMVKTGKWELENRRVAGDDDDDDTAGPSDEDLANMNEGDEDYDDEEAVLERNFGGFMPGDDEREE